ncbi:MAG TPA: Rieske 2Fe-2S domain-containing protein [Ramlibacter sp.]|uniref:Rieske 2Fe-2S domain-containing protein n=1 Tax=Ramlibacter sp. TaxID=1917967 RepID=UPI002BCAED4E|nr:Rieske 2Fe-2S domain-containing protein [Ramlibacter sp.]HVZ45923.1 Rieske 2Fe-2S domain-containing protein [Ramlibacter sp.]
MRTAQDHIDLTRVGPGTVMGRFMRQYWVPAAKSSELARGGAPIRLLLLGEKLIAFRDGQGRVGVMDHRCPHRCASLFLARNEEAGLRCVYHGWKFDVNGQCIDMPSVPPQLDFKANVKARAYRTAERAGLVWVYMGTRAEPPPLPAIEATLLPEAELDVIFIQRACNWLQSLEGDIDTSHVGFLHMGHVKPEDIPEGHYMEHTLTPRSPQYHVSDTRWGTAYAAYRNVTIGGAEKTYWRFGHFMFPFWTQFPQNALHDHLHARAWVPLDDEHTMTIYLRWKRTQPRREPLLGGVHLSPSHREEYLPNTSDWLGRFRVTANERNDWGLDREAQSRNIIFTGIDSIYLQDQAVCESMGPITDHSHEHLGPGDLMVVRTRRRLLAEARKFAESGNAPPALEEPESYLGARGGHFVAPAGIDWMAAYRDELSAAEGPAKGRRAW